MNIDKPFSQACENNKAPILDKLKTAFADKKAVLEVGSGTGQHAVYFAQHLPQLTWQCADRRQYHEGINSWLMEAKLDNVLAPLTLEVDTFNWPPVSYDGVFSANTAHIMSWPQVKKMLRGVGKTLSAKGKFCLYGPFNYQGNFTSESNARFDQQLKAQDPAMGIRNFEDIVEEARQCQLELVDDFSLPANNHLLVFRRLASDD